MWQELIIRNTIDGVGNYTYTVTAEAGEAVLLNEGTRTLYRIQPWGYPESRKVLRELGTGGTEVPKRRNRRDLANGGRKVWGRLIVL